MLKGWKVVRGTRLANWPLRAVRYCGENSDSESYCCPTSGFTYYRYLGSSIEGHVLS